MRIFLCCTLLFICVFDIHAQNKLPKGSTVADVGDTIKYTGTPSFCPGGNVLLTANNAPNNATFQWQKDGTDIAGATSVNYTATTGGNYIVIVTSGGTPTTYPALVVTANPKPLPDFNFNNNNTCSGTTIAFTPSVSSGTAPFTYSWDFGDASALSALQNPTHVYTSFGCNTVTYSVKLTVIDANGCTNFITKLVTVKQVPDVRLTDQNAFSPFKNCDNNPTPANPNYTITVTNGSPNPACISSYTLDWGDGSPIVSNPAFPITHTYTQLGAFNIVFTGVGTNGCSYSKTYLAANQSNPDIGIATFGSTIGCAPLPVSSIITTWQSNSPGTTYLLQFGDGTVMNLTHPLKPDLTNDTIYHTYTTSPCPSPTYQLSITATNGCKSKSFIGGDIEVRTKPTPKFSIPKPIYCVNQSICFTNQTIAGYYANCATTTNYSWDFGDGSPVSTQANPCHTYTAPGVYTISLTSSNPCGSGTYTQQVCITGSPTSSFNVDKTEGCAPVAITTTNNSDAGSTCTSVTYKWTVSYSQGNCGTTSAWNFANGSNDASTNPSFSFTNPGNYTITLAVTNACGTVTSTKTVVVKSPPTVSLPIVSNACSSVTLIPTATVVNCGNGSLSYQWTFNGGALPSSTNVNPGAITFNTIGTNSIVLAVTNECGTGSATQSFGINPAPDLTVPSNLIKCGGEATGPLTFSSTTSGTTFTWTNNNTSIGLAASGNGSTIPSFTATNNTSSPVTATITVSATKGGCPTTQSFTITVNPRPASPVVSGPYVYCLNEEASPLTATASSGNTLTWYNNSSLTGGTAAAPTPNTSTAGTTTFYVTQTNSYGCMSSASSITVTVNPKITGNTIGSDQTICTNTTPNSITQQSVLSGGNNSFTYQWQQSTDDGLSWTNITGATGTSYAPGNLSSNIQYRRIVKSSVCSDTSNVVIIIVQGTLSNVDISAPQTICAGTVPSLLVGQTPLGGSGTFTFQWESSLNGTTWNTITGENGSDYQPPSLTNDTYYRRLTKSGPCSAYSSPVKITVNPIPVVGAITDRTYCNGSSVNGINFTSTPSTGVTYAWTNDNTQIGLAASGNGTIPSFNSSNNSNPKDPVFANISVTPTYTNGGKSCAGNAVNFKIIVLPAITVNAINNETICTGVSIPAFTPVNDADNYPGSSITYSWIVSGSGTTLTNGSGASIPQFKGVNNGTTDLVTTITVTPKYNYSALSCDGTPVSYTVTVKPGTPAANAGPDAVLCAANNYTMKANQPLSATGVWTQITGTATITNASSATTTITGLNPGNSYTFEWSLSGFASCPDTKDTVVITIDPDVVNTIATSTQTTCSGGQITVNGDPPTGGSGTYSYQWQQSTDNISWTNIAGATSASLTFIPAQTVYVKRIVTSLPCIKESLPAQIIVQPGISNNKISADQSICINTPAAIITGAMPSGGDGVYSYQWEQSTNGGTTWSPIPGATLQDYSPGILIITTKYRRLVNTNLCTGPQANTSNVVTITVNPNAKAVFNPTTAIGCIPFKITPAIINLQTYPLQNSQYLWYVNNVLIGSGTTFPGYTMNKDNDTITVKLVTVSSFGCLSDSVSHDFYTYETPQPSFTVSQTVGCAPLTVQITNTTPNINAFSYQWNFGNGQTSSLAQPGQVIFQPNPNHSDTTYQIKLSVASACNTVGAIQPVTVKSKPKALFAPDKSVGCSPMTVTFNNTSLGNGNSYVWDFGDGSAQVNTTNTGSINHTFTTGGQDTFYVRLVAINGCGNDTLKYAIVVSPNQIHLDFAINGNQFSGCAPHTVQFVNNSIGATLFSWNFGDGNNTNTIKNIDTVSHTYLTAGSYTVTVKATNGCSDTTSTEAIVVFAKPRAKFAAVPVTACIGDSIRFTNQSTGATSYLWKLGDGNTSTLTSPIYKYSTPGNYNVDLIASSFNAPNTVCTDTISQPIQIVSSMPGSFSVSDSVGYCAPFTVTFTNLNAPSTTANWDFGDGTIANGDVVTHTYTIAGTYQVTLNVFVPGGCNYITKRTIKLLGPSGSWTHTTGYLCNSAAAYFQVTAFNTDSLIYQFGDGTVLTTTSNTVSHVYTNGGIYLPSVILKNKAGCLIPLKGIDSIRVDKIKAGFSSLVKQYCGYTTIDFTDTTHAFFGKSQVQWEFGDGTTASGTASTHTYYTTGNYSIKLIVTGKSGCSDTLSKLITIQVYNKPITSIIVDPVVCERYPVLFNSGTKSADAINIVQWSISNGVKNSNQSFTYSFNQPGNYSMQLIVGTVNGCYDTATSTIKVNPTPNVTASNDVNICRGSNTSISASGTGVNTWNWWPASGLSCTTCTTPVASPLVTTPYVIEGKNTYGCSAYDTVVVTVIQPLHLNVKTADSICIGQSVNLLASGASSYSWSPSTGLNSTSISNPTASPTITTSYRVVGYDGFNCFTDTAFVTVAVGQYPTVNLGSDLTLAAGTLQPLNSTIQNGPIRNWLWTPSTNLSCNSCALPIATIKKDISYLVKVTTAYGCSATDTINIKVFCESTQTFIPNAFTPDGDGVNDILMVRGKGIVMVKAFRIFNRWGELVFEKTDFPANDPAYGWNGRINGVVGGPDVYVYTAEVMCENGVTFTYKGNVSLIK